ncbi:MAG: hypothetical protein QOK15_3922, partial [Nocardioidaceae bacterium]|nr:hypothetical protein [Nocardioidaceae bacterium]
MSLKTVYRAEPREAFGRLSG